MGNIYINFLGPDNHRFSIKWDNDLAESQFEIAAQELKAIADKLRGIRLAEQFKDVKIITTPDQQPSLLQTPPAPATPDKLDEILGFTRSMDARVKKLEEAKGPG